LTSLFAGYSKSFGSNNGYDSSGNAIPPEVGTQYETGLKTEAFEKRLLTTVTIFELAKTNILNPDPADPTHNASIPIGEMRNRGAELDVSGNVGGGFSVIGSYAFYDPRISKDTNGNAGHLMPNVPVNSANFWGKYDFGTAINGWSAGLGANMRGERQVDNQNTIQLPAYTIFSAMGAYRFDVNRTKLSVQLNVENLTDQKYWDHADAFTGAFYGAPRNYKASISAAF
jgi:iron complex outermembrane receptor protein